MKQNNEIKALCVKRGLTLTYIAEQLGKRLNKKYTVGNLSKKLNSDTIKYSEVKIILDILNYRIDFIEK